MGYEQTGERDAVGWHHLEGRVLAQRKDPEAPSACLGVRLIEIRSESRGLGEAPVEVNVDSTERACTETVDSYQFDSLRWEAEIKAETIPTTLDTRTYERPVGGSWALQHREVSSSSVTFELTWTAKADGIPRAGTCGDSYYWWPFFTPRPEECALFVHRPAMVTGMVNFGVLDATLNFARLDGALGEEDHQYGGLRLRLRP